MAFQLQPQPDDRPGSGGAARSSARGFDPAVLVALGASSLRVTRLGLGAREIGRDPVEAEAIVQRALGLGIRYFDTAPSYVLGLSEERIGAALAHVQPDLFVLSTKVGRLLRRPSSRRRLSHAMVETFTGGALGRKAFRRRAARTAWSAVTLVRSIGRRRRNDAVEGAAAPQPGGDVLAALCDYSYDGVMRSVDESMTRLGLDRIDLALIHDPEMHHRQAIRGAYRALDALRAAGTIGAIGVGMNRTEPLIRFAGEGRFDAFLLAGRYTLLDQSAAEKLFDVAAARGISIILGGVFNGGLLADPTPGAFFDYLPANRERVESARRLKAVCERHGVSLKAAALQFSYAHPAVTTMLLGASSVAELDESIQLLGQPIPDGLWRDLERDGLIRAGLPRPASP